MQPTTIVLAGFAALLPVLAVVWAGGKIAGRIDSLGEKLDALTRTIGSHDLTINAHAVRINALEINTDHDRARLDKLEHTR